MSVWALKSSFSVSRPNSFIFIVELLSRPLILSSVNCVKDEKPSARICFELYQIDAVTWPGTLSRPIPHKEIIRPHKRSVLGQFLWSREALICNFM